MNLYSAIIIGGGVAGTSCAIAMQKKGIKDILILERGKYDQFAIGESIPPTSKKVFHDLGIYDAFLKERHIPSYGACSYWGSEYKGFNDSILSPYGHGWHLDRQRFNLFLAKMALDKGISLITHASFLEMATHTDGHIVSFEHQGTTFQAAAPIIIDATGNKSLVAKQFGAQQEEQSSLICLARRFNIPANFSPPSQTIVETCKNGWWYAVRLPHDQILIAFYTSAEVSKLDKVNHQAIWEENLALTQLIHQDFDFSLPIEKHVKGFHAKSFCLDQCSGQNWLAIGDAASAYDPITSRGIMKAMVNGLEAADHIHNYLLGKIQDFSGYDLQIKADYQAYLVERSSYYLKEQRWNHSPFWKQMHQLNKTQTVS